VRRPARIAEAGQGRGSERPIEVADRLLLEELPQLRRRGGIGRTASL